MNLAVQARFLMAVAWLLFAASMLAMLKLGLGAPLSFLALCFLALLWRVIRRVMLHRFGLVEVENVLCNPDPLGPAIDQLFVGQEVRYE